MQYAIAHLDQDGNGDSDKNPYISVDFENNLESCLEAANMMEDEGYKEITPFILEDEGKKRHLYLGVCETAFHLNLEKRNWGDPAGRVNALRGLFCCDEVGRGCRQQVL